MLSAPPIWRNREALFERLAISSNHAHMALSPDKGLCHLLSHQDAPKERPEVESFPTPSRHKLDYSGPFTAEGYRIAYEVLYTVNHCECRIYGALRHMNGC